MMTDRDEQFMRAALDEAKKALGRTSPNPAVGAVLVIDNRVVSKGHAKELMHTKPDRRAGRIESVALLC